MMSWRYRLAYIDYKIPDSVSHSDGEVERQWGVVEFYPSALGEGGWTGFIKPIGDDKESLLKVLNLMIKDISRDEEPILLLESEEDR